MRSVYPGPTGRFLDLAAGTMDVTRELKRRYPRSRFLAMDFALPMLAKGLPKIEQHKNDVQPVLADGRALPLASKSVDGVTIAFGIRNIRPREAAYAEILRVLAPGGRLAILEFGTSSRPIWSGLYNLYLNKILPLIGRIVSGDRQAYSYLADTIADFPTATALEDELRAAGFVEVFHESLLSGIVNIHVAHRRRFEGEVFMVGKPSETRPEAAPHTPAPKAATPEAGTAHLKTDTMRRSLASEDASPIEPTAAEVQSVAANAANTAAGIKAMEKAMPRTSVTAKPAAAKTKKAKAAPKAKAKTAKPKAEARGKKSEPKTKAQKADPRTAAPKTETAAKTNKAATGKTVAKAKTDKAAPKAETAVKATKAEAGKTAKTTAAPKSKKAPAKPGKKAAARKKAKPKAAPKKTRQKPAAEKTTEKTDTTQKN